MASSESALKITLALARVPGFHLDELSLRLWDWLSVRGRVAVTLLGAFLLYCAWRAFRACVLGPIALHRRDVISTVDRTRTIDPALREPIDDEVRVVLAAVEESLGALGFSAPQRTTSSATFPIPSVRSLLEHSGHGDLATIAVERHGRERAPSTVDCAITLESRFADGTRLVTTTSASRHSWPARPMSRVLELPPSTPTSRLYEAHRARAVAQLAHTRQLPLSRGATADQRLVFAKRETLDAHNHLVAIGHRRRTANGLRLTWKGAFLAACFSRGQRR